MPKDEFSEQDPMELIGMVLPGEVGTLEEMAKCLIEEYVRLGWDEARLMTLFRSPMFLATHRIYRLKGEAYVRTLIHTTQQRWQPAFTSEERRHLCPRSTTGRSAAR